MADAAAAQHAWAGRDDDVIVLGGGGTPAGDLPRRRACDPDQPFRSAFEHSPVGMAVGGPDLVVCDANPALCRLLGRPPDQVLGRHLAEFVHPDDRAGVHGDRAAAQAGRTLESRRRVRFRIPDGTVRWADLVVGVVPDGRGGVGRFVAHVVDASESVARESELRQHSLVDPLTELPNRRALAQATGRLRAAASATGDQLAVLFCDLDRFKEVNDTAGHRVGDELLRLVARRLRHAVRPGDLLARLGGDEFALVCRVGEPADALAFARRVVRCFDEPFQAAERSFRLGVSVGVAVGPPDADPERQLAAADRAMYSAKGGARPVALAPDCAGAPAGRASRADGAPAGGPDTRPVVPDHPDPGHPYFDHPHFDDEATPMTQTPPPGQDTATGTDPQARYDHAGYEDKSLGQAVEQDEELVDRLLDETGGDTAEAERRFAEESAGAPALARQRGGRVDPPAGDGGAGAGGTVGEADRRNGEPDAQA